MHFKDGVNRRGMVHTIDTDSGVVDLHPNPGSDAPVETIAPLAGIHAAVTRRRADGAPGEEGWYPEQRLNLRQAVCGYTVGAAFASGEEEQKGALTPGKLADLVVLDQDLFAISPMEILQTQVAGTLIGGEWVFVDSGFDTGQ